MPLTNRHRHRYGRDRRLLRRREFDAVFGQPSMRVSAPPLWLAVRPNDAQAARLGLVVGKKILPRAVDRNRAKRAIRESFRLAQRLPPLDIVVRVVEPGPVSVADAERIFAVLRQRLARRKGVRLAG